MHLETQARDAHWLVANGSLVPPVPPAAGTSDARDLARQARQIVDRPSGPLGPLAEIGEHLGVYLTVVDVDADGASAILDGYGVAVIGRAADSGRRRWTAAHELGHHLLRDEYTAEVGGVSASRSEREQLVDRFAGEFLLPEQDLVAALDGITESHLRARLVAIAAEYRVSWSAAILRAQDCGLVTPGVAQVLRANKPVRGDFLAVVGREPQPDLELGEHGPQWKRAALKAHREGLITGARAVELIGGGITVDDLPDGDGP